MTLQLQYVVFAVIHSAIGSLESNMISRRLSCIMTFETWVNLNFCLNASDSAAEHISDASVEYITAALLPVINIYLEGNLSPLCPHCYLDLLPLFLYPPPHHHHHHLLSVSLTSSASFRLPLFALSGVQDSLASRCDECLSEDSTAEESLLSSIISLHHLHRPPFSSGVSSFSVIWTTFRLYFLPHRTVIKRQRLYIYPPFLLCLYSTFDECSSSGPPVHCLNCDECS